MSDCSILYASILPSLGLNTPSTGNCCADSSLKIDCQGQSIINLSINFNSCGLNGDIPSSIQNLQQLQTLDLGNNRFTSIPNTINQLPSLINLHLELNQIGSIPSTINQIPNLQKLTLTQNGFSASISTFYNMNSLQLLDLSSTGTTGSFSSAVQGWKSLQFLHCDRSKLNGPIPPEFAKLSNLRQLTLNANSINGVLPGSLAQMSSIQQIDVSSNPLSGYDSALSGLISKGVLKIDSSVPSVSGGTGGTTGGGGNTGGGTGSNIGSNGGGGNTGGGTGSNIGSNGGGGNTGGGTGSNIGSNGGNGSGGGSGNGASNPSVSAFRVQVVSGTPFVMISNQPVPEVVQGTARGFIIDSTFLPEATNSNGVVVVQVPPSSNETAVPASNQSSTNYALYGGIGGGIIFLLVIAFALFLFGKQRGRTEVQLEAQSDYLKSNLSKSSSRVNTLSSPPSTYVRELEMASDGQSEHRSTMPQSTVERQARYTTRENYQAILTNQPVVIDAPGDPIHQRSDSRYASKPVSTIPSEILPPVLQQGASALTAQETRIYSPDRTSLNSSYYQSRQRQSSGKTAFSTEYTNSVLAKKFGELEKQVQLRSQNSIWREPVNTLYLFANGEGVIFFDEIIESIYFPTIQFTALKDFDNSSYSPVKDGDTIEIQKHLYNGFFIGKNLTTNETDTYPYLAYSYLLVFPKIVLVHLPERKSDSVSFELASKVKGMFPDKVDYMAIQNYNQLEASNIHNSGIFTTLLESKKILLSGSDTMVNHMEKLLSQLSSDFWTFVDVSVLAEEFDFSSDPYPLEFYQIEQVN
ncbi:hypothetical protein HDV06_003794 [Boothiomyces sp. JEL0866]|nr:hypothetical protein HDV06_003794 [Boothiomyces sp. JEL0866]